MGNNIKIIIGLCWRSGLGYGHGMLVGVDANLIKRQLACSLIPMIGLGEGQRLIDTMSNGER